jgi:hypothetical protein
MIGDVQMIGFGGGGKEAVGWKDGDVRRRGEGVEGWWHNVGR